MRASKNAAAVASVQRVLPHGFVDQCVRNVCHDLILCNETVIFYQVKGLAVRTVLMLVPSLSRQLDSISQKKVETTEYSIDI